MKIYLATYRGFCSGVKRSIRLAEKTLAQAAGPVYILNDIVHNKAVVENLRSKGLKSVAGANDVDAGTLMISAHGVPHGIIANARKRGLEVADTTCPLVYKIHDAAKRLAADGYEVILFGDPEHDEVKGILAVAPEHIHVLKSADDIESLPEFEKSIAFISQSTRNVERFHQTAEALMDRFGSMRIVNTICRATRLRQESVQELAEKTELVIVVGSPSSANTRRLAEIAESLGTSAHMIESADELNSEWLDYVEKLGITAGASTPDNLVTEVINKISDYAAERNIPLQIMNL